MTLSADERAKFSRRDVEIFCDRKTESYHYLSDSTVQAIAGRRGKVSPQKLRQIEKILARDDQDYLDEPSTGSKNASSRSSSTFNGEQGKSRPAYSTPVSAANRPGEKTAKDQGHEDVKKFLKGKLSADHYDQACDMMGGDPEELKDFLYSQMSEDDYNHVCGMMEARDGESSHETPDQAERRPQKSINEMEGQDDPLPFAGMPRPGGLDRNTFGFDMSTSESNSRRRQEKRRQSELELKQAATLRQASAENTRRQNEKLAQDEAKQRRASEQTRAFAVMSRDAPAAVPTITQMYPGFKESYA